MNPRAVVDTHVFVGACLVTAAASRVNAAFLTGKVLALAGTALLSEYEDVMALADLFARCRLSSKERDELLDMFLAACEWTRVYHAGRPKLPDEADKHLVELAVAGGAGFIVTRNLRDLTRGELNFPQLRTLSPEDFLKEIDP